MAWRQFVSAAYQGRTRATPLSLPRFEPAATEGQLQQAESSLRQALPEALRELLSECDGIMDVMDMDGRLIETGWLMWNLNAIMESHRDTSRTTLAPPDSWLVFTSAGADGIVFAFDRGETDGHIWAWHPMERRRQHMAESLAAFLRGWIIGELTV